MIYKVVHQTQQEGVFRSAIMNPQEDKDWCLTYKPGEITKPDKGYIYAFKHLEHANYFCYHNSGDPTRLIIFECEGEIVDGLIPLLAYSFDGYEKFWETGGGDGNYAPQGTVWCKWVKLIKIVED